MFLRYPAFWAGCAVLVSVGLTGPAQAQFTERDIAFLMPPPPVNWLERYPCDAALSLQAEALPLGSVYEATPNETDGRHIYRTSHGAKISVRPTRVNVRDYHAETLFDLWVAIRSDRALKVPSFGQRFASTRLAKIRTVRSMSARNMQDADGMYRYDPALTRLTLSPRIELIRWVGADQASEEDRTTWLRQRCEHIHHEVGHFRVTAHMSEEILDELFALRADSKEALGELRDAWWQNTAQMERDWQERYHTEIAEMGPEQADAGPYESRGFSWYVSPEDDSEVEIILSGSPR